MPMDVIRLVNQLSIVHLSEKISTSDPRRKNVENTDIKF